MFRNKRIIGMVMSFVLVLGLMIMPATVSLADGHETLTIVHVNDVHGRLEENDFDGTIGYPKIKTFLDGMKEENPNMLLLHAGDSFHGTIPANLTEGEVVVEVMNAMEFDAMVPGNHDFNFGYERLLELKAMSEFDILATNVVKEDGTSDFDPYMVYEMENGMRVGIFGIATEETKTKSHPDNTRGVEFADILETGNEAVEALEEMDVDMIIALIHLGVDASSEDTAYKLADGVDGIDLIIDGHSHSIMGEGAGELRNGALIVQAGWYLNHVGVVNVEMMDGEPVFAAAVHPYEEFAEVEADEYIAGIIEEATAPIEEMQMEVVGNTTIELDGVRDNVRSGETNLGNLITDAMIVASGADVALTNGGGIRASIDAGDITLGEVLTSFPFTNVLTNIEVTGAELMAALEHGVKDYPATAGHFPHVSGMSYIFDPNQEVGSRITELRIDGTPVDMEESYMLVTNDFLAAGGDGYTMFEGKEILAYSGLLSEVLEEYLRANPEISPEVEGRIVALPMAEPPVEPTPEPEPEPAPADMAYTVKAGDWLSKIGMTYGVDWRVLAEYNNLANPNLIFPGQIIMIPQ
ncbi:MAG: 5'-nucleotidase C-terminal domain-containing protein [Gudongella sp.]|nr:5'-nucleotidase C-terminal domain-containing protein [Gudongella sp.]